MIRKGDGRRGASVIGYSSLTFLSCVGQRYASFQVMNDLS